MNERGRKGCDYSSILRVVCTVLAGKQFTLGMGEGQKSNRIKREVKKGGASLSILGVVCTVPTKAKSLVISFTK